jgi:hypothetical protein
MAPTSALAATLRSGAAKVSARTTNDVDLVVLAYVAGQEVDLEERERDAALRRALFVFAAGGDLHRDPTLDDPAVIELASDLDSPDRRKTLAAGIERVAAEPQIRERLLDGELAWRAYACGLLADTLGEDETDGS